jgi:hypothetical protein
MKLMGRTGEYIREDNRRKEDILDSLKNELEFIKILGCKKTGFSLLNC